MSDSAFDPTPDKEWEALMGQLRAQPPARPRPFFYARVNARLAATARAGAVPTWLLRPAYAVLLGAVVLTLSGDGRNLRPKSPTAASSNAPTR